MEILKIFFMKTHPSKQIKAVEWEILVAVKDAIESIKQQWMMVYSLSKWQHHEVNYKQNGWYVSQEKCSCNRTHCWNSYTNYKQTKKNLCLC